MMDDHLLDARGLLCPLPVLKLRKRLKALSAGDVVALWADDPAAVIDVPHFCAEAGHQLLGVEEDGAHMVFRVEKGARA
ncbi:MAG: sulfurtransferase TusA family protein [Roseovarius sp.]